jgi:hypothetical protein
MKRLQAACSQEVAEWPPPFQFEIRHCVEARHAYLTFLADQQAPGGAPCGDFENPESRSV